MDGLTDGILHNPNACDFDPTELTCAQGQEDGCLGEEKVAAIKMVYDGPTNDEGSLFFGFPFGAEDIEQNGWGSWLTGGAAQGVPNAAYAFGTGIMRNFVHHDPSWTHDTTDWNAYPDRIRPIASVLDARSTDLSEFRAQGGKLLMYHGWADVALTAHMSTDYIEKVYSADTTARDDAKLFMMPGVLHCAGGPGPSVVNWLAALESWHATGDAPDELAASYPDKAGARKICAWPRQAVYDGGDSESPESFTCR